MNSKVDVFGATSTTDEVLSGVNLQGKRILVTGVSAGLGIETARSLAGHGADVVGAARDLKKAEAATAQVRKDAAAAGGSFELVALDLASLKSVRASAEELLAKGQFFDVITHTFAWAREYLRHPAGLCRREAASADRRRHG
jgi:NAD(P)-dependent dehydrogenase (short-subunit alcohol dehydrogenase family)